MNHKPGFVVPPPENSNSAPQFGPNFSLSPSPATPPIIRQRLLQDAYYSIPQYPNQPLESIPVLPCRKSNGLTIESIKRNKALYKSPDLNSINQTPVPKFGRGLTLELMNRNADLYNPNQNVGLHSIQQQHHEMVPNHREEFIPVRQFRKSKGLTIESMMQNKGLYNSPDLPTQDVSLHSDIIPTSHMSTLPIREGLSWDNNTNFSTTSIPRGAPCWVVKSKDKLMTIPKPVIMSSQQPTEENTPSTALTSILQLIDIDNNTQPTVPTSFSQLIDIDNNNTQPTVPITSFTQLIDSSWMGWDFTKIMDNGCSLDSVTMSNPGIFTETARDESAVMGFQPVYNLNSPPVPEADAINSETYSLQFAMPTPGEGQYHLSADENSTQEKDSVVPSENVKNIEISEAEAANVSEKVITDKNILQQQEEGKKGIDLNKTPKLKTPKKRKHRPKVIIEGKDKGNPKKAKGLKKSTTNSDEKKKSAQKRNRVEMENGTTDSTEKKLNGKRKFARKNEEPNVEHQRETRTRKALEFELEIGQNLEEIQSEAGNGVYEMEQHIAIARSLETGQQKSNHVSSQLPAAQENHFHGVTQTDENSKILEGFPLLNAKRDSGDNLVNGPEILKKMRTANGFHQMAASTTLNSPPTVPNWLISSVNETFTSNGVDVNSHSEVAKENTHQPHGLASFQLDVEKSQSSDYMCNNQNALPVGYHSTGNKPSQIKGSQKNHLEKGTPSIIAVTVKDKQKQTVSNKKGLQQKEKKKKTITVPQLISRLKELSIIDYGETGKMPLVPYKDGAGAVVPYKGNRRKRLDRVEVYLDAETDRVWKLLMGSNEESNTNNATDKDSEKWWDHERKVFHGRVESFIARMDLVQGKRRFSPWKGSVVDSVIGVFLTQNVSDHLSSSAYMSLLAKYGVHKERTVQNWFQGESSVSNQAPIIHENLFTPVSEKVPKCSSNSCSKQIVEDFGSSDNPNCCLQVHDEVISWVDPNSKPETRMNHLHYPSSSTHLHTDEATTFEGWMDQAQLFHRSTDQYIRTNAATEVRRQFSLLDRYDDAKYLSTGTFSKTDFYPGNERVPTIPEKATGSFGLFRDERNCSMSPFWSEVPNSKMNHSSKSIGDQAKNIIHTIINRSAALSKSPFQEQFFPISSQYINESTNSADTHNQVKPSSLQQQIGFNRVSPMHEQISRKIQTGYGRQVPISPNKRIFLSDEMPKLDDGSRQQVPISPNKRTILSHEMPKFDGGRQQAPMYKRQTSSPDKRIFVAEKMPILENGGRRQVPMNNVQTISPDERKFVANEMPILENGTRQQVPMNNVQTISPDERKFVANEMPILENGRRQQVPNDPMNKRQTYSPDKSTFVADDILKLDNGAVGINAKESVHSSGESNHGKTVNSSSKKKAKTEGEKAQTFDWDSLRREVEANGKRKERCSNTMDSLDYEAIRKANVNEISNTIKERGMNNMLAGRIKKFLDRLVGDHGAADLEWLRDIPPNKAKDYLLSFNGLGLKSVECVRLLTLHQLAFPVDTNVGRIAVRLGWVPLRPLPESLQLHLLDMYPVQETIQKYLWPRLCKLDQLTLYQLHYQMITFGKVFCTKSKPNCNACPLRGECRHFASALASTSLLPGPEEVGKTGTTGTMVMINAPTPVTIKPLQLPSADNSIPEETASPVRSCEPIVEEPASPPEPERVEITQSDIEDAFYEDPDEIPTIQLNLKEFTQNLQNYMQENMDQQESDFSKALIALTPEIASIPAVKLKNVSRLRTEHQVYELPDSHPLLNELERREPDDPSPYLLAIWTPGETASSTQLPERSCGSQDRNNLCNENTCFSCNSIRESNAQIVRGTLLIPCRTAMRGSFPLNGTYFQVNEMFADHESSLNPINVPRSTVWNLTRRTVCFGTSVTSIFKGLSTEKIQKIFWEGFICVRGFDRKTRAPRPLLARLHFPASKSVKVKNDAKTEVNPDLVAALKKKVLDDLTKKQ